MPKFECAITLCSEPRTSLNSTRTHQKSSGIVPGQSSNDPREFSKNSKIHEKPKFSGRDSKFLLRLCSLEIQWLRAKPYQNDAEGHSTLQSLLRNIDFYSGICGNQENVLENPLLLRPPSPCFPQRLCTCDRAVNRQPGHARGS